MNGTESVPSGYGLYLIQTLLALGAVCLLAYVVLRVLAKRLHGIGRRGKTMRVVEQLALDQRRSLYVVEVAGRTLLLGGSDGGVSLITELDPEAVEALLGGGGKGAVVEADATKGDGSKPP